MVLMKSVLCCYKTYDIGRKIDNNHIIIFIRIMLVDKNEEFCQNSIFKNKILRESLTWLY